MIYFRMTNSERVAEKLLKGQPKAKPFAKLVNGKVMYGTKSLHLTPQSCKWRKFWRLKKLIKSFDF